jgi:hypothetical protein
MIERKDIMGLNKLAPVPFKDSQTVADAREGCRNGQGVNIWNVKNMLSSLYHGLKDGKF